MSLSTSPTYNLKVVIKETGIAADTLRAWERRYSLPMPKRSPGGHRLYSQYDIEIVKWLMEKQGEGMSISRAVGLWKDLNESGQNPLAAPLPKFEPTQSTNLDTIREQWSGACLGFNENIAEQVINQAFALHPLETVCLEVMQKGLVEIGEKWYQAEVTVQQEHFTSSLAHMRLNSLLSASPPPTRSETVLIGCAANEQHTFTTLLFTLLLRRRGLRVVFLGADVPNQRFKDTLLLVKPDLVILSAQLLQTARGLRETAEFLNTSGAQVAYGGRIFTLVPELRSRIPAHFLGETIPVAIQSTESLLASGLPLTGIVPINEPEIALSKSFFSNRAKIELNLLTDMENLGIPNQFSLIAIDQFGDTLYAAISFGNLEYVMGELEWIKGLLHENNQDISKLGDFLSVYANSIDLSMGKEGHLISSWLRAQTI